MTFVYPPFYSQSCLREVLSTIIDFLEVCCQLNHIFEGQALRNEDANRCCADSNGVNLNQLTRVKKVPGGVAKVMGTGNSLSRVINRNLLAILEEGSKSPKDPEKRFSGKQENYL